MLQNSTCTWSLGLQSEGARQHDSAVRTVARTHGHWIVNDYEMLDSVFSKGYKNSFARLSYLLPQHANALRAAQT
jgi:hypothetical protein